MKTEDFISFNDLKNRVFGKKSGTICHYTSYESLIMILKNRSLRLSRYDLMNDIAEKQLSKCDDGDCRYIISFTGTISENVAMWALYGKHSSLKLRLSFSRASLIETVHDNFYFDSKKEQKIPIWETSTVPSDYSKKNFTLSDVVYYDRIKGKLRLSGKTLLIIPVDQSMITELAGTIKYDAWEYERESRLAVILHQNAQHNQFSDISHVYAGLNDEFIKKLTITYSPWITDEIFEELSSSIDSLAGYKLSHKRSSLQGEVGEL